VSATDCAPCAVGRFSPGGDVNCTDVRCAQGYSSLREPPCAPCNQVVQGFASAGDAAQCLKCPAGKHVDAGTYGRCLPRTCPPPTDRARASTSSRSLST
jgi:hypothetical protein